MKNVKLAFSVYALTLALASNGAWAAIGKANPSCEATEFTMKYVVSKTGCEDANGFGYYNNGATADKVGDKRVTWDASFTTPKLADYAEGNILCLGADLVGWEGTALKDSVDFLSPGGTYTSNTNLWNSYPSPDGSTEHTLNAVWRYNQSRISLDTNGARYSGNPTALQRNGVNLLLSDTSSTPMSISANKLTNLPQKDGYTFQGYFLEQDRATAVGNFWTTGADAYAEGTINCKGAPQSEWAKKDGDVVKKCPWIASTGYLGNNFVGTAAAAIGTDSTLYAAWEPREFQYQFNYNCDLSDEYTDRPDCDTVFHPGSEHPAAIVTKDARYANTDISLPVAGDQKGFFEIDKWSVTISNGKITETLYIDVDADGNPIDYTTPLNLIISKDMWQKFGDTDIPMVTFKAVWKVIPPVKMNFYSQYGATEPFATYEMTVGLRDFMGGTLRPYVAFHEVTEDNEKIEVSRPIPEGTSPNDLAGAPQNATLRGFVMKTKDANAEAAYSMVDQDAPALQTSIVDKTQPLLMGMRSTTDNSKWIFAVDVVNETSSGGGNGSEDVEYVDFIKDNMPTNATEVNVYGVWAENCTLDTGDASCKMYMSPYGAVNYVNTCSPGYNIGGSLNAGTKPSEGVFEADSNPAEQ